MTTQLTDALEDYLETVFRLVSEHGFARVKEIATARDVKAGSVSPALKRLSEMGLVNYVRREYVTLTPEGEKEARRIYSRHRLLTRFFGNVLQMSPQAAEEEACAMEHSLSNQAMDRLVRFFEFLAACPNGSSDFLERFHGCSTVHDDVPKCPHPCTVKLETTRDEGDSTVSAYGLKPGEGGKVLQVNAQGSIRQRILDMGILPGAHIELLRVAPTGDPIWIELDGTQLALRRPEAEAVLLSYL